MARPDYSKPKHIQQAEAIAAREFRKARTRLWPLRASLGRNALLALGVTFIMGCVDGSIPQTPVEQTPKPVRAPGPLRTPDALVNKERGIGSGFVNATDDRTPTAEEIRLRQMMDTLNAQLQY